MQEMTTSGMMGRLGVDNLKQVGRLLGIDKRATRKADVIEAISACIRHDLPKVLAYCSKDEKLGYVLPR